MKFTLFNILIIALFFLVYVSGVFEFFSSPYLLWGVVIFIVILFIIAVKIIGLPQSKE